MTRTQIVIDGNPGIILARVAPLLSTWLGENGCVLGGGTVLAARWRHRVSADIDLFTDIQRYRENILARRDEVTAALEQLVEENGYGAVELERAAIASELRTLPAEWSGGEPVREPAWPELAQNLARRARRLFEADPNDIGSTEGRLP